MCVSMFKTKWQFKHSRFQIIETIYNTNVTRPYKRYEYDPTVPIPKSTSYSKRKRGCEKEATENNTTYEDGINSVRTIFAILYS